MVHCCIGPKVQGLLCIAASNFRVQKELIKVVNLIQGYSYFISLEIVVGYKKLRNLQGTKVSLIVLMEKPDIRHPSRNY